MAHTLNLGVIAEGVEIEEQARMLQEIGCDALQGFLFCKPSDPDVLADYVREMPSDRVSSDIST
jgi:EAL domain-containing protein (putative c-di-GMP-specific phosphodiesterase class I)